MKRSITGFTLIELMIVTSIVAILAAVALPAYQEQMRKSRRSDAVAALEKAAARQEQFYFRNNNYTADESLIGGAVNGTPILSPERFYQIRADIINGGQGFTLTADPVPGGPQASDPRCTQFTLTHLGQKGATPAANVDLCWTGKVKE